MRRRSNATAATATGAGPPPPTTPGSSRETQVAQARCMGEPGCRRHALAAVLAGPTDVAADGEVLRVTRAGITLVFRAG